MGTESEWGRWGRGGSTQQSCGYSGPGGVGILPWVMMKAAVAIARTRRTRTDKAQQEGVGRGAPPRGQAARPGPAFRPRLFNIWPRPGSLRHFVASARWVGPKLSRPSGRSFPSLGCTKRNRVGKIWAWFNKAPPLVGSAFETLGPGQPQRSRVVGRGHEKPRPSG